MDLFAVAGIDLSDSGAGKGGARRLAQRSLRVPLLNHRVVEEARRRTAFDPSEAQLAVARDYAKVAGSAKFARQKETAVRNLFFDEVLGRLLGYSKFSSDRPYTLAFEQPIRRGAVDVALGRFGEPGGGIIAPFELKGPGTRDLDAIMPGRGRSPVQQAWDYAIDAPGSRWVLVSNCVEIRLYGWGRGRDAYEVFDLAKLGDFEEHARLWLLLSADRLLGGDTEALLRESESAYKRITDELYHQYSGLREELIGFLVDSADGPDLPPLQAIETAQKLLDRILFIAFAQRTGLLPEKLLERSAAQQNFLDPYPLWRNFQVLFRHIDGGRDQIGISAYNGGLFAADPIADGLILPDALAEKVVSLGEWDYKSDVPVTLLGHIFEQSVTDLEKLRAARTGQPAPAVSKQKREGVVYTPDVVTRFLVERTVGLTLSERFDALLAKHGKAAPDNGDPIFAADERETERAFWRDYSDALRDLTIVDPACGSGAFLVAAFNLLAEEYRRVATRLDELGEKVDFDPLDEIVTKNLFGVDLNAESVEITRLALWLKTARRHHRLQNLEATIHVGNSLIDDPAYSDRPFDWRAAFPQVFARGGFDVAIGNPPYVRMELIKPVKPYLEKHYVVAADRADLYAYFFERGVGVLKDGGRLGYISSSTFFRTGSGENLRAFLGDGAAVEAVVDFGDLQLFEGVTTYPAIVTLRKGPAAGGGELRFLKVENALPKDLGAAFDAQARPMPRARLGAGSWRLEDEPLARLRDKIAAGRRTLGEVYGPPLYGIKTGFNEAFIIDTETRDRLVAADPKSAELLKPFLRGENVKRWRVEPEGLFLINTPKGKVHIDSYPAIRDWLLPFKPELEKRATKQEWFELQQAQLAYQPSFSTAKVIYGHFAEERIFAFDRQGFFSNDKSYFVPNATVDLLAFLNSKTVWSFLHGVAPAVRGGWRELRVQYIEKIPIPVMSLADRSALESLGASCTTSAARRLEIQSAVRRRLLDLAAPGGPRKLTRKLENWWQLDFAAFRREVKRAFRAEIPLKQRAEWESYLAENAAEIASLSATIASAEREIDAIVYRLFDLTPDEVALLEQSLQQHR
ncbi:MAG: N-6 DNA methylase [Rhizobiales bacterium]|nr:N-6 DNA methylase [Hyphomicrobiales bacterium]